MTEASETAGFAFRVIFKGWTTFGVATIAERDGTLVDRALEDHGSAACVMPYDPARRVALLVVQMRVGPIGAGLPGLLAEAPAGGLDDDEPEAAAIREAFEETGLRLRTLEPIGSPFTMPSISTERLHLFLAPYAPKDRVAAGGGLAHEGEQLTIEEVPLSDLAARAAAGTLDDLKTLVLVQALMLRQPHLFTPPAAV